MVQPEYKERLFLLQALYTENAMQFFVKYFITI